MILKSIYALIRGNMRSTLRLIIEFDRGEIA